MNAVLKQKGAYYGHLFYSFDMRLFRHKLRKALIAMAPIPPSVNIMVEAYCVKCRKKVEMKNAKAVTMKNGRPANKGECPGCGTGVYRIGKSK